MPEIAIITAVLATLALLVGVWLVARRGAGVVDESVRARQRFESLRPMLQASFFERAQALGKPRGLRWTRCEWSNEVRYARDLQSGLLTAFAGVQIHFEAIEGGDMEDIEAVGDFREASAVFHYQDGVWGTGGKALFNLPPTEAMDRLRGQFEPLPPNAASPSAQ